MRAIATLAIVAALATSAFASPKWHELNGYSFDKWTQDFGRNYASAEEREMRREIFNARLQRIQAHNEDKSQTYHKGVNQFSDWTESEFAGYNTADPVKFPKSAVSVPIKAYNATGAIIPGAVDYRRANPAVLSGVKNQGHCGSCWAHSTAEGIESFFAIAFGQLPVLSTQQITACTTSMFGCGGGNYFAGWQFVGESNGLYEEWEYPYMEFFAQNMSKQATSTCRNISAEYFPNWGWVPKANVTGMWAVEPNNATATMEALALHGPLSISVGAGDWSEYESGILFNPNNSSSTWAIDHAVQLVGYGFDTDVNLGYWVVRNSWGTTWGESGFIRLYRPEGGIPEPCGKGPFGQVSCGTSGLLNSPGFPDVAMLKKLN